MLIGHSCTTLICDLEEMFAIFYWVAMFPKASTSAKQMKNSLKLAKIYKPGSSIGPIVIRLGSESRSKPINNWNKGDYESIFYTKNTHLSLSNKFDKSIINYFVFSFKNNIDFQEILEKCWHKIYSILLSVVIRSGVNSIEYAGAISVEIMKKKKRKEFETWNMSELKTRAKDKILQQIK